MPSPATDLATAVADAFHAGDMQRVIALAAHTGEATQEDTVLLLGLAQQATCHYREAATTFRQLAQRRPDVSAHWNNLGVACRHSGDATASEHALLTARALAPNDADVLYNLGLLYVQERRWPLARDALLDAAQASPDFIEARLQAAFACHVCGDNTHQEAMLAGVVEWPAQPAEQALTLAAMLSAQGDMQGALRTLAQAQLPAQPGAALLRLRIVAQRVMLLERNNQLDHAQRELAYAPLAALDGLPPDVNPAEADRARCDVWRAHAALAMRTGAYAEAATLYRRVLALAGEEENQANAGFGLAAACDRLAQPAAAWSALLDAHAIQLDIARSVVPELLGADSQPLHMAASVDHAAFARWQPLSSPDSQHSPIFVVGFPRSGTTLLEQMLDAHPDFQSMDERAFIHELTERMGWVGQHYPDDLANLTQTEADQLRAVYFRMVERVLPDFATAQGRPRRLVDKNPLNMLCLPMIMRLFPQARIIVCLRHPCDVLLSCTMQPFRSPAFMVLCSSLQRLARGYVEAFAQWQRHVEVFAPCVLEWRYESVVEHFDDQVMRLGKFLDVADASPMARFAEHAQIKQFISTPSYAQVTKGIHPKAVGRWHNYREQFEPILPILQPLMDRMGYRQQAT